MTVRRTDGSAKKTAKKSSQHKGFKATARDIAAKENIPLENANAILASSSRKASAAAKKKDPALKRVKGKSK